MIQLLLPEHMQPQELRKELLELDPGLKIGIGPEKAVSYTHLTLPTICSV